MRFKAAVMRATFARRGKRTPYGRGVARASFRKGYTRTAGYYGRYTSGGELKFFDLDLDDAVIAATGTVTDSINKIAQGTTEVTRIGRKCTIKAINWRFNIDLPQSTASASTGDVVRVIMFIDRQCNGATATVTDILESANYQSFNNLANKSRFSKLMDKTYSLTAKAGGGDGTTEDYGRVFIADTFYKKCNLPIEFDSTAGAITEIRSNNIGVLMISLSGLAGFESKIRLRFSDS